MRKFEKISKSEFLKDVPDANYDDIIFTFTVDATYEIARIAFENKEGARGLRRILDLIMLDIMFELSSKSVIINKEHIDMVLLNQRSKWLQIS